MKQAILLLALVALTFSCHKETDDVKAEADYLVFGYSLCFCDNCCNTGYKISEGNLFKGEKAHLQAPYQFESTPQEPAKYELAKKLWEELPDELLNQNNQLFGCGGCLDQPVFYVEMKQGDVLYRWKIDSKENELPAYLQGYAKSLSDILLALQ